MYGQCEQQVLDCESMAAVGRLRNHDNNSDPRESLT